MQNEVNTEKSITFDTQPPRQDYFRDLGTSVNSVFVFCGALINASIIIAHFEKLDDAIGR